MMIDADASAVVTRCPPAQLTHYVGVSLGGGRGKNTAVARLERRGDALALVQAQVREGQRGGGLLSSTDVNESNFGPAEGLLFRDEHLLHVLRSLPAASTVVAVDVPLTMPPCLTCALRCPGANACTVPQVVWMRRYALPLLHERGRSDRQKPVFTPYTQRSTDVVVGHVFGQPREGMGQGMGPLVARATYLQRALSPHFCLNINLIEVMPRLTLERLFGATLESQTRVGSREETWEARKVALAQLGQDVRLVGVWPEMVVRNDHVFHAVVGAFAARMWAEGEWSGPQDIEEVQDKVDGRADERGPLRQALADLRESWRADGWTWFPPKRGPRATPRR